MRQRGQKDFSWIPPLVAVGGILYTLWRTGVLEWIIVNIRLILDI